MQQLVFNNQTPTPLDLAVWQVPVPPSSLVSVYWMRLRATPGMSVNQQWNDSQEIVLALFRQGSGLGSFAISQSRGAESGSSWIVATASGVQVLVFNGQAPSSDEILARNDSTSVINVGLAQSGVGAFYAQNLPLGEAVALPTTRTYMAGLFMNVNPGEVLNPLALLAVPMPLVYPPGMTKATATAVTQSSGIVLTITYGL